MTQGSQDKKQGTQTPQDQAQPSQETQGAATQVSPSGAQAEASQSLTRLSLRLFSRHRGRMLFFASCIAIGVGFLFGINSLLLGINRSVATRARSLMAADVTLSSWRPYDKRTRKTLKALQKKGYRSTNMLRFVSMLRLQKKGGKQSAPFLVSVKAIEARYPFYGSFEVAPASYKAAFFGKMSCLLGEEVSQRYKVKLGDKIHLGHAALTVVGWVKKEPDQMLSPTGIAPRVMIPYGIAKKTGLLRFGSRISHNVLIATNAQRNPARSAKNLKYSLVKTLANPYIRIRAYSESQPTIREVMRRIATFFIFVSLVALLLGAIGMAASVTTFLNQQLKTVGIFRCVGLSPKDVTKIYHRLCLAMGILGGIIGIALGIGIAISATGLLNRFLDAGLTLQLHWFLFVEAMLVACGLTVGLNYVTVNALARLTPHEILSGRANRVQISQKGLLITSLVFLISFFLYALKTAFSFPIASFFTITIVSLILLCSALILLALWILEKIGLRIHGSTIVPFALRHGLRQLVRQRVRSLTFLLSLCIGATLISSLNLLQHSLVTEIRTSDERKLPNLFLVDVQKDQVPGVKTIMSKFKHRRAAFNPLIRARLTHVNRKEITSINRKGVTMEARSRARFLTREYNLTYKDKLNPSETVTAGRFWKPGSTSPEVSLEQRFARRLGVGIGNTLTFDIQGRSIRVKVTSIRKINWMSLLPNFFVVMPIKVLQHAPQIMITSIALHQEKDIPPFQSKLNKAYPNISVIPLAKILNNVQSLLSYFIQLLQGLAWACVLIGLLILAGTLSMGRAQRRNKVALMRSLGSNTRTILLVDTIEFLTIGLITSGLVLGLSWLMSSTIASQMNIRFHYPPMHAVEIFFAAVLLPLIVGFFSNRSTYQAGVMENLRNTL